MCPAKFVLVVTLWKTVKIRTTTIYPLTASSVLLGQALSIPLHRAVFAMLACTKMPAMKLVRNARRASAPIFLKALKTRMTTHLSTTVNIAQLAKNLFRSLKAVAFVGSVNSKIKHVSRDLFAKRARQYIYHGSPRRVCGS